MRVTGSVPVTVALLAGPVAMSTAGLLSAVSGGAEAAEKPSSKGHVVFDERFKNDANGWDPSSDIFVDGQFIPGKGLLFTVKQQSGALSRFGRVLSGRSSPHLRTRASLCISPSAVQATPGVACRAHFGGARWGMYLVLAYLLTVRSDGIALIARRDSDGSIESLTESKHAVVKFTTDGKTAFDLEADCMNTKTGMVALTMHVNGKQVAAVKEPNPIASGPQDIVSYSTTTMAFAPYSLAVTTFKVTAP